jgi:nitroreductase
MLLGMNDHGSRPPGADAVLRALRRTRQVRQFADDPVSQAELDEILEVARWSGSSTNWQPWRFLVIRDRATLGSLAELLSNARHVGSAPVVLGVVMPNQKPDWEPYDEGRLAERVLVAAGALGLGAGIGWVFGSRRPTVAELLGLRDGEYIRTVISIGHPSAEGRRPKSAPGQARKPLSELVTEI